MTSLAGGRPVQSGLEAVERVNFVLLRNGSLTLIAETLRAVLVLSTTIREGP